MIVVPRIPEFMCGLVAKLDDVFVAEARKQGWDEASINEMRSIMPASLLEAGAGFDLFNARWVYDYRREPFRLAGHGFALGEGIFEPVARLVSVLWAVLQVFTGEDRRAFVARLEDPEKHGDTLAEFSPVLRVPEGTLVEHEVSRFSPNGRTIDWLLTPPSGPPVLLEVKNRLMDMFAGLELIASGRRRADGSIPAPQHRAADMFRSVAGKFTPGESHVKGVWILSQIKQPRSDFLNAFAELAQHGVDFAILTHWDSDDCFLVTRAGVDRTRLLRLLALSHSDLFVF